MKKFILALTISLLFLTGIALAADPIAQWTQSTGDVTGYTLYYSNEVGSYAQSEDVGNVTSYNLNDLTIPLSEGQTYYFIVRATNATGESGDSNTDSYFVPFSEPEGPPTDLTYYEGVVSWTAPSGNFDNYKVYYNTGDGWTSEDVAKELTSLAVDIPCGSISEFYMVAVLNNIESDPTSTIAVSTKACTPGDFSITVTE